MRIHSLSGEPIHSLTYLSAGPNGVAKVTQPPIRLGLAGDLGPDLEAIICTGDLQGVEYGRDEPRLLGEVLAEELAVLLDLQGISPAKTGVIFSGDYFSSPRADQRGASGDVSSVWKAFAREFRWVVGVLGNHDQLDTTVMACSNAFVLDGSTCLVDGLKPGGISGITGNSTKPLRCSVKDYLALLSDLKRTSPDILILHESPAALQFGCVGSEDLAAVYERKSFPLTICGHVPWPSPLVEMANGNQLLNVDSKVVILRTSKSEP